MKSATKRKLGLTQQHKYKAVPRVATDEDEEDG